MAGGDSENRAAPLARAFERLFGGYEYIANTSSPLRQTAPPSSFNKAKVARPQVLESTPNFPAERFIPNYSQIIVIRQKMTGILIRQT
jgi:hypothetical protein